MSFNQKHYVIQFWACRSGLSCRVALFFSILFKEEKWTNAEMWGICVHLKLFMVGDKEEWTRKKKSIFFCFSRKPVMSPLLVLLAGSTSIPQPLNFARHWCSMLSCLFPTLHSLPGCFPAFKHLHGNNAHISFHPKSLPSVPPVSLTYLLGCLPGI